MTTHTPETLETALATFLRLLAAGQAEALAGWRARLIPDRETIIALASSPSPSLAKAWRDLAALVTAVDDNHLHQATVTFNLSPRVTALAVAATNFLTLVNTDAPTMADKSPDSDGFPAYNLALAAAAAANDDPWEWLLYDTFITPCADRVRTGPQNLNRPTRELFRALLATNPISGLKNLDLELPEAIRELSGRYLVKKPGETFARDLQERAAKRPVRLRKWWLQAEAAYADRNLRRILIESWLELPENGLSGAGTGIFLEELRLRDPVRFRRPILEFYEAYDYLSHFGKAAGKETPPPQLEIMERLLRASDRELNRRGNERFLKFRALLEIIAEEQAVPHDFKHLSRTFCLRELLPLTRLATVIGGRREALKQGFSGPQFSDHPI